MQQYLELLKWFAKLPHAKMLAITLGIVCYIQYLQGEKKDIRLDFKERQFQAKDSLAKSYAAELVNQMTKADSICNARYISHLEKQIEELKQTNQDVKALEANQKNINNQLSKTIRDANK